MNWFSFHVYGVLTFIAQKCSLVVKTVDLLHWSLVLYITTLVFASVTESMSLLYMCPITSTVVSEYLRNSSLCCLLVYDDLSKHAVSYRHLSLALLKPVGREAFHLIYFTCIQSTTLRIMMLDFHLEYYFTMYY